MSDVTSRIKTSPCRHGQRLTLSEHPLRTMCLLGDRQLTPTIPGQSQSPLRGLPSGKGSDRGLQARRCSSHVAVKQRDGLLFWTLHSRGLQCSGTPELLNLFIHVKLKEPGISSSLSQLEKYFIYLCLKDLFLFCWPVCLCTMSM